MNKGPLKDNPCVMISTSYLFPLAYEKCLRSQLAQTPKRPLGGADTKTVGTGVYLKAIKTNTAAKRVAWKPEATTPLKQCIDLQPHVGRPNPQFFIYQSNVKSRMV